VSHQRDAVTAPIRLLIVDDHSVVREGLRAFLRLQEGIEVVGEAADGEEAVRVAATSSPDVVLLDLVMPSGDGIGAIRRLIAVAPGVRVLILTSFADDAQIFAAIAAGAAGYLLKDVDPQALADGIRDVHAGRPALHSSVAARLMHGRVSPRATHDDLTERERDVLRLVVEGLANKQIAQRLGIGEKTIKTHVSRVLAKLGVADRTQAAVLAIREGLVD
jgi:NarL family two-component system response regulator LiaR